MFIADLRNDEWQVLLRILLQDVQHRGVTRTPAEVALAESAWLELRHRIRTLAAMQPLGRIGLHHEAVEDLVQQLLLRLQKLDEIERLARIPYPQAYLARMLHNAGVDVFRDRAREIRAVLGQADAAQRGTTLEMAFALRQALDRLSEEDRELILLRFLSGLSIKEIALRKSLTYGATAMRLFRITRMMREYLT